jgi:hypothetical protein
MGVRRALRMTTGSWAMAVFLDKEKGVILPCKRPVVAR